MVEPDEVIMDWIREHEPCDEADGYHTIQYGDCHLVLAYVLNHKHKYIGWFCVSQSNFSNPLYRLLQEIDGIYLYRLESDYLPEYRPRFL